jgi:tRNA (adenine22-N1)-methyltransferase
MIKLTDRLQKIADFIDTGESVADIGTDHGFLPISLWESGKSPYVILSDINAGPLEKARYNTDKYYPGEDFDVRIGNGIDTLKPAEVDAVVIAGMGGILISEILGADPELTRSFKRFILQPRNAQDKLRGWLLGNGFRIDNEALVREGKYLCEIILAVPSDHAGEMKNSGIDLEISPLLFEKKDPLLVEFIENKIRIEKKILEAIRAGANRDQADKLKKSEERITILQELRNRSD